LVLAGCDRRALAALAVSSGLCRPARDDGMDEAMQRQAWRGEVLEALDAHAREIALRSRRGWPLGYATALAHVALQELAAPGERWTDAGRRDAAARLGVRVSKAAWSQTWGERYQAVLGEAHRLASEAVRHIRSVA
jgi:hypothetical protein